MAIDLQKLVRDISIKLTTQLKPQNDQQADFCADSATVLTFFIRDYNLASKWEKVVDEFVSIARANKNLSAYQIRDKIEAKIKDATKNSGHSV